jgi:asparaginyl-tRNA synthetase
MAESVEKPMADLSVSSASDQDPIYTSETRGSDECGDGTFKVPYKTLLQAMRRHGKEPFPVMYQDAKEGSDAHKVGKVYDVVAKSQIKKMTKMWAQETRKAEDKVKRDAEALEAQKKRAEEAKKVTIEEDKSLPKAERLKIRALSDARGKRVQVRLEN